MCFCSVSIWHAGWIWSSTGGLLRKTWLSDRRDRLILQPNTSTRSTSLALTAPPQQSNRMMYVSQSHVHISHMFSYWQTNHFGIVISPFKLNHCQLPEKALERQHMVPLTWQSQDGMWAPAEAQHPDLINRGCCGSHTISHLPSLASCRLHADSSDSRVSVGNWGWEVLVRIKTRRRRGVWFGSRKTRKTSSSNNDSRMKSLLTFIVWD